MAEQQNHSVKPEIPWWREIPLAVASFCFFKLARLLITPMLNLRAAQFNKSGYRWSVLSGDTIKSNLILAVLLTRGPRWNTHALIATTGPFRVGESVAVDASQASQSAGSWTIVIYRYPGMKTVATFNSGQTPSDGWVRQTCPEGKYTLGLRYYDLQPQVVLPAVKVDGKEFMPPLVAPPDANGFYRDLAGRAKRFHGALNYYVFAMLRWEKHLPALFVRANYLPVGDPETHFYYGRLRRGQTLSCQIPPHLLDNYRLYYTQYNRASFPVSSLQIASGLFTTPAAPEDGYFLFRLRPLQLTAAKTAAPPLTFTVSDAHGHGEGKAL